MKQGVRKVGYTAMLTAIGEIILLTCPVISVSTTALTGSPTYFLFGLICSVSQLIAPKKNAKGESLWYSPFAQAYQLWQAAASKVRQPVESFFACIIEKTGPQNAQKVRSVKGLNVHLYAKAVAALLIVRTI